ncbi:glycosyltransferase [Methanospirillum stamsii]|nr:glycosyltransferase [Methanospirillum stamsii]
MERLAQRGHSIRVIDYDIDWKKNNETGLTKPREVHSDVQKIIPGVSVQVIRPRSIRISVLEYPALMIAHRIEISRQIAEFKLDIIVGFGILNAWLGARLAQRHGIPFVYYWIDALDTLIPEKFFQMLGRFLEKQTLHNSTRVIAINEKLQDYAITLGSNPEHTSLIGAGIDLERFNPGIDGNIIREQFDIRPDETVLFFMGWLYHFSGLKEICLELARCKEKYRNLKILIVGDGDAYEDLQKIREENNLMENLILTGKQPYEKIPEFIAASDICMLPADPKEKIMQDIVPIKMYEYMAMGKPVITTKLPGLIKEFGDNNGVLYADSSEKVLDMANSIVAQGAIDNYGISARSFVQGLNWGAITDLFENLLIGAIHD